MKKILVIGYVWPEPTSSAAGSRMLQLLEFFIKQGWEVNFGTTSKESENMADLEGMGIQIAKLKLNDSTFDFFLSKLNPEIVLFDRYMIEEQFGWRVDEVCPEAIKILDTEDLHFLRYARQLAFKEGKEESEYYNSDLAKREISAIYRCDLSLIISEKEQELLVSKFNITDDILIYLPFLQDEISREEREQLPEFEERSDFIFIGNFLHEPNWHTVLYLKENIWPELRKKLPEARMQIYGAYPSQKVLNLHNEKEGFIINGWTENSSEVFKKARVCLAPIQFGAGLKGKLVEAMLTGTPSVTTPVGAEGINKEYQWNGFIEVSDEKIIEKAVQLYSDRALWKRKQVAGFTILSERFPKQQYEKNLSEAIQKIEENSEAHRSKNFIGDLMKFHLNKSSFYLSKYIEEKNRNKN